MHHDLNLCSLNSDSSARLDFFLLLNFASGRFILTTELNNIATQFFFFLLSPELPPFHLQEALYSFSLVSLNCSITTLVLWHCYEVKQKWLEHKYCDPLIADLIMLIYSQNTYTGQSKDSCSGSSGQGTVRFHHATKHDMQFRIYDVFMSGIFYLLFLEHVDIG